LQRLDISHIIIDLHSVASDLVDNYQVANLVMAAK
jgi:hypothetical protein